jgi:23S rRNA (cytidine1920-2'-O)/16S rRNA (cytidine1409-2'-O)-methyltransferase
MSLPGTSASPRPASSSPRRPCFGRDHPWVSRGGVKLAHGLDHFGVDVTGATGLDIGSSTGGFTDVLLSRGAAKVYAVDVGTNQLAWKLRQDDRVVVMEQTNAKTLTRETIPDIIDIVVCDASFIGLAKVLGPALELAREGATLIALVKPQFEAGRGEVGKGGVVRDPIIHQRVRRSRDVGYHAGLVGCWRRDEPDHRTRRQCRVPARRDKRIW